MKKTFSIIALLLISIILLIGCDNEQKTLDSTPVAFNLSVGSSVQAKALTTTNPATAMVDAVYIRFEPKSTVSNYTEGATDTSGSFTYDGKTYEVAIMGTPSKSGDTITCTQSATKYLSQGQWTIKAVAVHQNSTATTYTDDVVLYYGETTVWVNKTNAAANLTMIPVTDDGTGTVSFGNGSSLIKTHASIGDKAKLRLSYDIDGTTGTIDCSEVTNEIASFTLATNSTIKQGAHLVKIIEEINDGTSWIKTTGGYVIPVYVVKAKTTYITGDFNPSEWISSAVTATIELGADVKGTLSTSSPLAPVFTLTGDATNVTYQWYVDGVALGGTTTTGNMSSLTSKPGRHNVQIVAKSSKGMFSIGYILKIDGSGNASVQS